jgi:hypothetical protein
MYAVVTSRAARVNSNEKATTRIQSHRTERYIAKTVLQSSSVELHQLLRKTAQ